MQKNAHLKNILVGLAKAVLALGILFWLYQKGVLNFEILGRLFDPPLILGSMGVLTLSFFFATWRWQLLLRVQKIHLGRGECFKLNLIGLFFNYVMPGGVGGDVVKGYYIIKDHPQNRMGAGMSVLLDRVMGLYAMLILAIISMLVSQEKVSGSAQLSLIARSLEIIFVLFTLGLILAFSERFRSLGWQNWFKGFGFGRKLISAYEAVYSYSHNLGVIFGTVILSLFAQVLAIVLIWWVGSRLGFGEVPAVIYFSVVPLGFMVTAVPISPAGVGVGQMAFFFLFNLFLGTESQVGPTVITAFQLLNFILGLSGVWFFIQRKSSLREVEGVVGS
ncbi:MAG: hypothetical protein RJB66_1271 [Pseudomonadota bacterium]|jgi:uncharacterized protein (TIRG00374 family)